MKKSLLFLIAIALGAILFVQNANAQIPVTVSGTAVTVPALDPSYTSLANALTALNAVTSFTTPGDIIFTCTGGASETAPPSGLMIGNATLNPLLSSTNTVTIKTDGGVVTLNAGIGTATPGSATPDGMLKIFGADYITIDGLTFTDGNAANPATMEFGVALFKLNATDGAQNNTIKNCIINMQRINNASGTAPMVDGAVGILVINSIPTAATTVLAPSTAAGANSNNKFYTNTINGGNIGMALIGYAGTTPFTSCDTGNDVGGLAAGTGNFILNYGGGGTSNPAAGIRTLAQYGLNISYNTVNNNNGSGVNHATTLRGIYTNTATSASETISYNNVTVKSGATTSQLSAIENVAGGTAASNAINIIYNTITTQYSTATSGVTYGIYNTSTATPHTLNINNNTFSFSTAATSGSLYAIYQAGAVASMLNTSNNNISSVSCSAASNTSLTFRGIYITSATSSTNWTASTNNIANVTFAGAHSGPFYFIQSSATCGAAYVNYNTLTNLNIPTSGIIVLFHLSNGTSTVGVNNNSIVTGFTNTTATTAVFQAIYNFGSPSSSTHSIYNNDFSNITLNRTGGSSIGSSSGNYGIFWATGTTMTQNVFGNTISNLTNTGAGMFHGIFVGYGTINKVYNNTVTNLSSAGAVQGIVGGNSSSVGVDVYGNTISGLTSTGAATAANGLIIGTSAGSGPSVTINVYRNTICGIAANGTIGVAQGVNFLGAAALATARIYNNRIGGITAPASTSATAVAGINILNSVATSVKLYYNTVYLSGTSTGIGFGSSAFAATVTVPIVEAINNIFVNATTPTGTGLAVAHRRGGTTLTSYASASNNNMWYGTTYYYDGTNTDATFSAYQTRVATRDSDSKSENLSAVSIACGNAEYLKVDGTIESAAESNGQTIAGLTDDFNSDGVRTGYPQAGQVNGGGDAPDLGAYEYDGKKLSGCSGTPASSTISGASAVCANSGTTLSLSPIYTDLGITYQWASGTTSGSYPTTLGTSDTQATGNLLVPTYYICTVTCTNSGQTFITDEKLVGVNANPTITVDPTAASICLPGGSAVTLNADGGDTYSWSPATGLTPSTGATVSANPATTTTYTVTGTAANGCTNTATSTITIGAAVTMSSVTADPASVCSGGGTTLTAMASVASSTYCVGAYSTGSGAGDYITNVTLGSINNSTGASSSPYNTYYNLLSTNLSAGAGYTLTGTVANGGTEMIAAWIDYNQDGIFDAVEKLGEYTGLTYSIPFTVPGSPLNGTTRLRVRNVYSTTGILPCNSYTYGEIEDYNVVISGGTDLFTYSWSESPANSTLVSTTGNPTSAANLTASETYTVIATAASGCSATGNVLVEMGAPLVCTDITYTPACDGIDFSLTANSTGGGGTLHYAWSDGKGGVYPDAKTITANMATETYEFSVTITDDCGGSCDLIQTIVVGTGPGGTANGPASGLTYIGMLYDVTGYETGSTFQWQVSTTDCSSGFAPIPGADTDEVTLVSSGVGTFYINCIVTGVNGCTTTTNCITTIVALNGDNVCSAIPLSLGNNGPYTNVGATTQAGEPVPPGTGTTTQTGWDVGQTISNTIWFSFVAPASGRISVENNPFLNRWDNQFAVYSAADCGSILTGGATLLAANDDSTVSTSPYKAWIAPICLTPGVTYYLQVDGWGTSTNGNWGINLKDAGNAAPEISGCPTDITIPANAAGCTADVPWTAPTALDPDDCISPLSFTSNFNPGDNFPLGETTVTYTADDGVNNPVTCSFKVTVVNTTVAGITGNLDICDTHSNVLDAGVFAGYLWSTGETTQTISVSAAGTYTVTVTDANGCTASASATTTIIPSPTVFNVAGGGSYCMGGTGVFIFLTGSELNVNYELWMNGFASGWIIPGTTCCGIAFPDIVGPGVYTIVGTSTTNGCTTEMSGTATVTVDPIPIDAFGVDGTSPICSGESSIITISASEPGTTYQLRNDADNSLVGVAVPGGLGSIELPTGPLTSTTTFNILATYTSTGCSAQLIHTFTVVVNPLPEINLLVGVTGGQVCTGSGTSLSVALSVIGTTYQLRNDADNSLIGLPVAGDGGTILLPTGPLAATTTFNILATIDATGCSAQLAAEATVVTVASGPVTTIPGVHVCTGATTVDIPVKVSSFSNVGSFSLTFGFVPAELRTPRIISRNAAFDLAGHVWPEFDSTTNAAILATGTYKVSGLGVDPSDGITLGPDETLFTLRFNIVSGTTYSDITFKEDVQGTACEYTGVAYDYTPFCDTPTETYYIPGSVTVNPLGQVDAVADQVVCNDALTTTVTFTTTNVVGTTTYDWTNDAPGIGLAAIGSGDILAFTAINTGTAPVIATITVTPTLTDGEVGCVGTPISFTITVNPSGQVNDPDDQVVCVGSSTTLVDFITNNTGGTTTFTWTNNETGIGLVAEGTGNILAFATTNTTTSPLVATITVIPHFSNSAVTCDGAEQTFTITVNPLGQVNNPGDVAICNGELTDLISFTTNNLVGTTTYSWTNSDISIGLDANGTGDILAFNASNTTNAPVVATITVTPHFTYGLVTCDGLEESFTITVNPTGQVNDPDDQLVCDNSATAAVTFGTTNTVGTTTYTWLNNTTSIGLGASGSGNIASFTATNTTTAPVIATITVTPHFEYGSASCDGAEQTFTITVNPRGQVNIPDDQVLCVGESTELVTFGTANTGGTTTYLWSNSNTNIGLAANGTGDIASFVTMNAGTAPEVGNITVTPYFENGSVSCEGLAETFTITVNPAGQVNISVENQIVCNNALTTPIAFTTNNTVGTTTYTWTNNTTSIGLGASGSGNIPAFTATNTSTAPVLATITVTPHFEYGSVSCTGTSKTLTILVNPTGQVNEVDDQLLCNGAQTLAVTFSTVNTGGPTIYIWTNNEPGIGLAAAGTGNIGAFTATNTGTAPVVATITVTPAFMSAVKEPMGPPAGCAGTPITFTITVNPTALMDQPGDQTVSNGSSTAAVNFTSSNTGGTTTYSWTNNTTSIGLGASGTGNISSFTAINSGVVPVVATIIVTPTFTSGAVSCPGPPKTFTITVNPKPILVITNQSVCSPHKVNLTLPAVTAGSFLPPVTVLSYFYDAAALNPIAVPTSVGNGTYYIKATITPGGWYDIKPVVATVNPLPTIFTGVPSFATICSTGPGIEVGISGSQIGVDYSLWIGLSQVSSVVHGTGLPITFSPPLTASGNYWVLAQNLSTNCITRMYNCIDISVTPALTVSVTITTPTTTVVADQDVTFTATPVNGGVTPSYQWKVNGFNVGGNSPAYTYKPVNGDAVTCVLTSSESCVSGPGTSNTLNMTVTGVGVNITVTGGVVDGDTRCYNASQTLTVAGGGTTFVVNSGGSATMIAGQNIIYLPGTTVLPGGYMHGYISTTYCGTKSPAIVATATGENELPAISQKTAFKIYPNPTTGNFTLEQTTGAQFQVVNVEIYSMRGGKVMTRQLTGERKHDFSISEFPAGLYFVKVVAGGDAETLKLIKTN